jgi:arylsulfate sulfotransferase
MAVKYEFSEHIIDRQYKAEQEMLAEFEAGNYTLENPLVKYNVYGINPLSAVVCFKTEEEVAITVTVLGKKQPQGNIYHTFAPAKVHVLPIVGLYSNYSNKVEIRAYRGDANVITIDVPDVFDGKDPIISMDTTAEYLQDNIIIVSPAGADLAVGYDYNGDARWHLSIPCVFDLKRLKNGNIVIGTDRLLKLPYYMSGLYEMSMCGKIYKEFRLPGGYHHDSFEMEDGNLLILTDDLTSDTVEDMCVLVDRQTGEILRTWDYKDFMPVGYGRSGSWTEEDWFHNNAVWYDKNTNSLTFSGRHVNSMVNIDFDSGKLNWVITDPAVFTDPEKEKCGWPQEFVDKYCFKPIGNNFGWQYEQHANVITPNGDVMCFDNHHWGTRDPEKYLPAKDNYSRGVRYRINTKDMTIEQVWEYGKDRGADYFSPYICNVEYYNEGHYMVHSGGIAYTKDGEPSEKLGPAIDLEGGSLYAITVELDNDVKKLELKVHGNFYRAEKLKLYTDCINLELGKGQVLGAMGVTKEDETLIPMDPSGEMLPDSCEASLVEEIDRFTFHSTFKKGQLVLLMLEQGEEAHQYFISTSKTDFKAMCVGTFLDESSLSEEALKRNTKTAINKAGLSGTYDIRVVIDDKKYETGMQITC